MTVDDFNLVRMVALPDKADSVAIVDSNAPLARTVALQLLKAVTSQSCEIAQPQSFVEPVQLGPCICPELRWTRSARVQTCNAFKKVGRAVVRKRDYHGIRYNARRYNSGEMCE